MAEKLPETMSVGERLEEKRKNAKKNAKRLKDMHAERQQLAATSAKKIRSAKIKVEKAIVKKEEGTDRTDDVKKFAKKFVKDKLTLDDREQANLLKKMIDVDTLSRYNMTPKRTLKEYFFIALANMADYVNWDKDGRLYLKSKEELTYEQTAAIREINTRRDHATGNYFVTKLKFHDKLTALGDIAKHFGLFEKDNSQKQPQLDIDKLINGLPGELNELVRVKLIKEMAKYAEQQDDPGRGIFGDSDEGSETIN